MADVTIKVRQNGPYKVSGPVVVRDATGAMVASGSTRSDSVVLCRCGHSGDRPSCDGSHRTAHS